MVKYLCARSLSKVLAELKTILALAHICDKRARAGNRIKKSSFKNFRHVKRDRIGRVSHEVKPHSQTATALATQNIEKGSMRVADRRTYKERPILIDRSDQ